MSRESNTTLEEIVIINQGQSAPKYKDVESNVATSGNRLGLWGDPHLSQHCRRQDLPAFSPLNDFRGHIKSLCPS